MSSNNNSGGSSSLSKCAACGKSGDNLKVCTSCEQVCYCNAKCRKAHRSKHKKECRQLAAERHNNETSISNIDVDAIKERFRNIKISDEELFADPPPKEDCDICFLPMPFASRVCGVGRSYMTCCGKSLCAGCVMESWNEMEKGEMKHSCPFCRLPLPNSDEENIKRCKKRMGLSDSQAFYVLGRHYNEGTWGLPQDFKKALDLWHKAADLGSCMAFSSIGEAYLRSRGVEEDTDMANHYYRLSAMRGNEQARHNCGGWEEWKNSGVDRATYMSRAMKRMDQSLKMVGEGYKLGFVTKDEYTSTLRACKESQDGMKSEQRANAFDQSKPQPETGADVMSAEDKEKNRKSLELFESLSRQWSDMKM